MKNNWICGNTPIIVLYNNKEINPENGGGNYICIKNISELYNKNNIKVFCNKGWIDVKIEKKNYLDDMIEISTDGGYFCCTKETEINGKVASCIKVGDKINTTWNFPYVEPADVGGSNSYNKGLSDYWYNIGKNIKDIGDIPIDIFNISIKDQVLFMGGFHSLYSSNSIIELNSNILTQYMWILSRKIGYAYKLLGHEAASTKGGDSPFLDKYRIQRVIFSNGYVKSIKILGVDKKYKTVYNIIPLIDPIRNVSEFDDLSEAASFGGDRESAASFGGDIVNINIGVGDLVLQF